MARRLVAIRISDTDLVRGRPANALRRGGDFAQFVRDVDLPAYWELFGWPEACRPDNEVEFVCD